MGDASGPSCGGDDEWEICNDNGFVYKRRRRLIRPGEAAEGPSTAEDPEVELRRHRRARRRSCLIGLRDRYRQELEQWDLLSSALLDLAAPPPSAASSSSQPEPPSVDLPEPPGRGIQQPLVDDLLHQVLDRCEEHSLLRVRVRVGLPGPIIFFWVGVFQVQAQEAILRKLSEICDYVESLCREKEEGLVESLMELPIWGSPRSLMTSFSDRLLDNI
ncbi:hypothetical protein BHE74_00054506 [Ensete ventricosum]|nr:hypothetical protein GW17_00000399 [Ensete ventricosum]RWW40103.1 hypothetical protein BHE74_00054506 [Ensete ventricosum]RZS26068.1 hypothetical protein BHM03_00059369 [Ensete ventricosum]